MSRHPASFSLALLFGVSVCLAVYFSLDAFPGHTHIPKELTGEQMKLVKRNVFELSETLDRATGLVQSIVENRDASESANNELLVELERFSGDFSASLQSPLTYAPFENDHETATKLNESVDSFARACIYLKKSYPEWPYFGQLEKQLRQIGAMSALPILPLAAG